MRQDQQRRSLNFGWKTVLIEEIDSDHGIAMCVDPFGRHIPVALRVRRAKGALPREGEMWFIDQTLGNVWSFAQIITDNPEIIEGFTARDYISPLAVLASYGMLQDQTVAVDTYPWLVQVDPRWPSSANSHWSSRSGPSAVGGFGMANDQAAAWIEWPVVVGTGHWRIDIFGYVDGTTWPTLNGTIISIDGTTVGTVADGASYLTNTHKGGVNTDITTPGKHVLRLTSVASVSLSEIQMLKSGQL